MNFGTVIGTIWATQKHPGLEGATLQLVRPENADATAIDRPLVAVDTVGAGPGERVFYITAKEAILAYAGSTDADAPIDAAIVGIVEGVEESPQSHATGGSG